MKKVDKVFYTLMLVTAFLPFMFPEVHVTHDFITQAAENNYEPRILLWIIPLMIFCVFVIRHIWEDEIKSYFSTKCHG
jgi:hypothetical protein